MIIHSAQWITHGEGDRDHKKIPLFSVSINCNSTYLATGGLDSSIRLWSITNPTSETQCLSRLEGHSGSVLCVRWSPIDPNIVVSSSDDSTLIVWGKRSYFSNFSFLHRLVGHSQDVTGLSWNSSGTFLASCGVDNLIIIYDVNAKFSIVAKLFDHESIIKGIDWDPTGQLLAAHGDQGSGIILWRTSDWGIEAHIKNDSFSKASDNVFYQRLSWSPDGSTLATANGILAKPVPSFVSVFITRNNENSWIAKNAKTAWTSSIALKGFKGPVEVVQFCPNSFKSPFSSMSSQVLSYCAVGCQDHSISIWRTSLPHPVVVIQALFNHSVMDLSWSIGGRYLISCSYDGTVKIIEFEDNELGIPQNSSIHNAMPVLGTIDAQLPPTKICLPRSEPAENISRKISSIPDVNSLSARKRIQPTLIQSYESNFDHEKNIPTQIFTNESTVSKVIDQSEPTRPYNTPSKEHIQNSLIVAPPTYKPILYFEPFYIDQQDLSEVKLKGANEFSVILPEAISSMTIVNSFIVLCALNSPLVYIYNYHGLQCSLPLILNSPAVFIFSSKPNEKFSNTFGIITSEGSLYLWDNLIKIAGPISLHCPETHCVFLDASFCRNGFPIISYSEGHKYIYNLGSMSWMKYSRLSPKYHLSNAEQNTKENVLFAELENERLICELITDTEGYFNCLKLEVAYLAKNVSQINLLRLEGLFQEFTKSQNSSNPKVDELYHIVTNPSLTTKLSAFLSLHN